MEGEIQVDEILYKVTPYGTFFTEVGNEASLNSVFNTVADQNPYTIRLDSLAQPLVMKGIGVLTTQYDDVRLLDNKVYFVDSFMEEILPQPDVVTFESDVTLNPKIYPVQFRLVHLITFLQQLMCP